jgi:LacI family transcriptional regulator
MPIIGISLRFQDSFDSQVARGIIEYAKVKNDWSLRGSGGGLRPLKYTGRDRCDAVIARIESAQDADRYASLGIPVVDIAGAHTRHEIHRVQNDDFATGRRAGEYLRRLGARSFAYCGVQKVHWSRQRLLGFTEAAGVPVDTMPRFERSLSWWQQSTPSLALRSWLQQLPEPTAIFCCNDIAGVKAIAHASDIAADIPSRLTLLGVDDEDLLCTLCNPSLSSVRLDCATIGFRGAALIDTMLESAPMRIPNQPQIVLVPPQEVVERESTTVVLEKDPMVAQAVRYIRTNFSKAITVEDVVHHCSVSRRNLEVRFKQARGVTIHAEIAQMRLIQACKLLKQTDLTIETIASECAFPNVQRFHVLFKRAFGTTPGNWRIR